ncbi:MAG: hypothetical protein IIB03_01380 [Acidobacteria bacterium]|nr:hypothetical protein [Acidobacteriota bacterium]
MAMGFLVWLLAVMFMPNLAGDMLGLVACLVTILVVTPLTQRFDPPRPLLGSDGEEVEMKDRLGTLPDTVTQTTGRGGRQLFFRCTEGVEIRNATISDFMSFFGHAPPKTCHALVAVDSAGEPMAIGGYYIHDSYALAWTDYRAGMTKRQMSIGARSTTARAKRRGSRA